MQHIRQIIESDLKITIRTVASIQAGQFAVDACPLQVAGRWAAADAFPVLQTKGTLLRWSQKIKHNTDVINFLLKRLKIELYDRKLTPVVPRDITSATSDVVVYLLTNIANS